MPIAQYIILYIIPCSVKGLCIVVNGRPVVLAISRLKPFTFIIHFLFIQGDGTCLDQTGA